MTWVPYWDDSFQQVSDLKAMYAAGFRVMAGYVAGGSSGKWSSAARIQAWFAQGPDTGFFPLFEAVGDEPLTLPSSAVSHAQAARAGARARGIPDEVCISPAMDRNITMTQAEGPVATYFSNWRLTDTRPPVAYIESDAGAYLFSHGWTAGTFSPAAYGWDNPAVLLTPANAPAHVVCTQEHNGVNMAGGNVDIGHIRNDAPCAWWTNTSGGFPSAPITGVEMTPAEFVALLQDPGVAKLMRAFAWQYAGGGLPGNADSSLKALYDIAHDAQAGADAAAVLSAKVDDVAAKVAALSTGGVDMDALAAKVADLLAARLQS